MEKAETCMKIYRVKCSMFNKGNGGEKVLGLQDQWMICRKIEGAYQGLEQQRLTFLGKDSKGEPSGIPTCLSGPKKVPVVTCQGQDWTILTTPVLWLDGSMAEGPRKSGCGSNGDSAK